jgi:transcriptional regulator with XRE-family HTH domain
MRAEWSPIFSNPLKRTPEQENSLRSARSLVRFYNQIEDLVERLEREWPDQVHKTTAAIAARQWVGYYSMEHASSTEAALRAFERWKTRARELGLEAEEGAANRFAVEVPDYSGGAIPLFVLDLNRIAEGVAAARERLRDLERGLGIVKREITTEELAEEFGVSISAVNSWVAAGLPFTRSEAGKGRPRLFDLEEVKDWIRQHGSDRARSLVAAKTITADDIRRAVAETGTMRGAAARLGVSEYVLTELRRSLGVHTPVPAAERGHAWETIRREELVDALERHEGRRGPIMEELGFSSHELRNAIAHHGLREHPFVLHPRSWHKPLPFTREQLEDAITRHAGYRDAIAEELGVSRGRLRDAIIDLDLLDHPMLQAGKVPARVTRSLTSKIGSGSGRGAPGRPGARTRGHEHEFAREATLVPFWLAALREVMARHPGRGGGRATAAEIGISPVSLTNIIQGKRVPGYEVMEQIMMAAGRPVPDWHGALLALVDSTRNEAERARGIELPLRSLDAITTLLGLAPETVRGLVHGSTRPSMVTIQKILEAAGQPYLVEAIATPETVAYGGRTEPARVAEWRRKLAAEVLRAYRTGVPWVTAVELAGADENAVRSWSQRARRGEGPFVEAVQEDPSLLPLPPHLQIGAEVSRGVKYGLWEPSP